MKLEDQRRQTDSQQHTLEGKAPRTKGKRNYFSIPPSHPGELASSLLPFTLFSALGFSVSGFYLLKCPSTVDQRKAASLVSPARVTREAGNWFSEKAAEDSAVS